MIHNGVVVDKDPYFVIDPITRIITNQSTNKVNIIQFDHNSERFTFSMPRIVEGHDMSECNVVQVHYANTDAVTMEQTIGIYTVGDLQIDENDNETITLSWLLSQNVTQRVGKLEFLIRFACTDAESNIQYAWNTAIFDTIKVAKGMNNTEVIDDTYPDVLATKEDRINKVYSITGKETSEKYPTALAVMNYVNAMGGNSCVLTSVPTEYTVGEVGRVYAYVDYTENENGIAKQLYACTQKYEIPGQRTTYRWVEIPYTPQIMTEIGILAGDKITEEQMLEYLKNNHVEIKEIENTMLLSTPNMHIVNGDWNNIIYKRSGGASVSLQETLDKKSDKMRLLNTYTVGDTPVNVVELTQTDDGTSYADLNIRKIRITIVSKRDATKTQNITTKLYLDFGRNGSDYRNTGITPSPIGYDADYYSMFEMDMDLKRIVFSNNQVKLGYNANVGVANTLDYSGSGLYVGSNGGQLPVIGIRWVSETEGAFILPGSIVKVWGC